jgi:glycosyltransferase involved in cell wall biosynthesis
MGLAEAMPHVQFISVEPEKNNRETFREALAKSDIQNIELYEGDDYNLPKEAVGCAAIVACEILEHVPDQSAFIDRLAEHVGGKPLFALTTPYGPWQWEIKGEELVRVHLHHLERADIKELAGHLPEFAMRTVPSQQPVGLPFVVGTHPWRFKWTGPGCLGEIDYMRKHREQAPMGTLALCMIARNAEHRIGAAIESLRDVASEVWVAIDETTTDDTKAVAEKCGAKTFSIPSPLDIGFAAARNLSIEKATTQWIMWLDCDEELVAPDRIYKYLRDSAITGIGVPQHHFSVDPPGVQKTDYPCRIFRHNEGMEFHGFVHEHPELVFNEGPGRVIQAMDLAITHPSYIDEAARRGRFSRNLPLMERDRRENPTRKLGHFLWLRDTSYILHEAQMRGDRDAAAHAAEEGEKAWQAIVDDGNIRLILDGLQYRSNHLELLRKGFWFSADIHGIRLEGPPAEGADGVTYPMRAKFADQDELHKILGMILSDRLEAFEQEEL